MSYYSFLDFTDTSHGWPAFVCLSFRPKVPLGVLPQKVGYIFLFQGCKLLYSINVIFFCLSGISFLGSKSNTTSFGTLFMALCKVRFFLFRALPKTVHHFPRLSSLPFRMFRIVPFNCVIILFYQSLG